MLAIPLIILWQCFRVILFCEIKHNSKDWNYIWFKVCDIMQCFNRKYVLFMSVCAFSSFYYLLVRFKHPSGVYHSWQSCHHLATGYDFASPRLRVRVAMLFSTPQSLFFSVSLVSLSFIQLSQISTGIKTSNLISKLILQHDLIT